MYGCVRGRKQPRICSIFDVVSETCTMLNKGCVVALTLTPALEREGNNVQCFSKSPFGLGKYQFFSVLEQFKVSVNKTISMCVHFLACSLKGIKNNPGSFWILRVGSYCWRSHIDWR